MAINAVILFLQDRTDPNQPAFFGPICSFLHPNSNGRSLSIYFTRLILLSDSIRLIDIHVCVLDMIHLTTQKCPLELFHIPKWANGSHLTLIFFCSLRQVRRLYNHVGREQRS